MGLLGACYITSLVAEQSFYSYICLPPFSTYANGKAIHLGDVPIPQDRSPLAPIYNLYT
jgi:hypothetical protein